MITAGRRGAARCRHPGGVFDGDGLATAHADTGLRNIIPKSAGGIDHGIPGDGHAEAAVDAVASRAGGGHAAAGDGHGAAVDAGGFHRAVGDLQFPVDIDIAPIQGDACKGGAGHREPRPQAAGVQGAVAADGHGGSGTAANRVCIPQQDLSQVIFPGHGQRQEIDGAGGCRESAAGVDPVQGDFRGITLCAPRRGLNGDVLGACGGGVRIGHRHRRVGVQVEGAALTVKEIVVLARLAARCQRRIRGQGEVPGLNRARRQGHAGQQGQAQSQAEQDAERPPPRRPSGSFRSHVSFPPWVSWSISCSAVSLGPSRQ